LTKPGKMRGARKTLAFAAVLILGTVSADLGNAEDGQSSPSLRDAKLLAFFSSTTITSVATTTKLALSTCWSTSDKACTGKRKRRAIFMPKNVVLSDDANTGALLEGSVDGSDLPFMPIEEGSQRQGKKMTIWSTGFTTVTVTTTSYYSGTTVTVSALCTVSGVTQNCFG